MLIPYCGILLNQNYAVWVDECAKRFGAAFLIDTHAVTILVRFQIAAFECVALTEASHDFNRNLVTFRAISVC